MTILGFFTSLFWFFYNVVMFSYYLGMCSLGMCINQVKIDQCVDPKILQVKVGSTIFALPAIVGTPYAEFMDETRNPNQLGILNLRYDDCRIDARNRWDCNDKNMPVADFRSGMRFQFFGDGSEPTDYRMGDKMYVRVAVNQYDPSSKSFNKREYLSDSDDIEKVRFVGRIDPPRNGGERIKIAKFVFSYEDRVFPLECQVGWYDTSYNDAVVKEKFPQMCTPSAFRSGDILISVDQRSIRSKENNFAPIPPQDWPKQWAFTIRKILDMRVRSSQISK